MKKENQFPKQDYNWSYSLCLWNIKGIIYHDWLNQNETMWKSTVANWKHRRHFFRKKCPSLVNHESVLLLHENTKLHIALVTHKKFMVLKMKVLSHPPYTPYFVPSIIFSYLSSYSYSTFLQGKQFINCEEVQIHTECFSASKLEEFYTQGIHNMQN